MPDEIYIREVVRSVLKELGFRLDKDGGWVTQNYALTHLLKPHRIGRKKLEKLMLNNEIKWKQEGRNIMINRASLFRYINE